MNVVAFILFVVAAVAFFMCSLPRARAEVNRIDLLPWALGVLTVGFIVQFCHGGNAVNF